MGIQVQELTQGKQPWDKEFIDFSFAGKHISEFDMVAVSDGDRYSLDMSSTFDDETSTINGLNGQYYWGTTFNANQINFKLATDGITEKQLTAFKKHFVPGKYGKLFVDERIGRYCWARVKSVITLNFIPFQEQNTIQGIIFHTNIYKGEASIVFEMDYPWWIAEHNYLETINQETIRKAYVNNVPMANSLDIKANIENTSNNISTTGQAYQDILSALEAQETIPFMTPNSNVIIGDSTYMITKNGLATLASYNAITDTEKNKYILYNASELATPISLTLKNQTITVSTSAPYYITYARDSINTPANERQYNMYFIRNYEGQITNILKYTNPGVFYNINKVIQLAYVYKDSVSANLIDFQDMLQEEIHHNRVLIWAARGLQFITNHSELYDSENGTFLSGNLTIYDYNGTAQSVKWYEYLNYWMLQFCAPATEKADGTIDIAEQNNSVWDRNSSLGTFQLVMDGKTTQSFIIYSSHSILSSLSNISNIEENCGEMILSEYLKVDGGGCLNDDLKIEPTSCYLLYHIKDTTLTNLDKANMTIEYRYLYL